jgi:predicted transcriptional regulator
LGAPCRRVASALGGEGRHASQLGYADGLDLSRDTAFEPIGISCRICERQKWHQRAVPPLERHLHVDADTRDVLPYEVR